jgi:hypothetical protein
MNEDDARTKAIEAIDVFVSALSEPLRDEDRAANWTTDGQQAWLKYMRELSAGMKAGDGPGGAEYNIMRGLDFDGVWTGRLADYARETQRLLAEAFPRPAD